MRFPLSGRARDLHPLDYAHVGRTQKNRQLFQAADSTIFYGVPYPELAFEDKSTLLAGDYKTRSDNIQNWINKEEDRIRYFPSYDGIEPFIAFAKDTVEMIKTHHIEE